MLLELNIIKDTGAVFLEGGAAASAALRLGDTLELSIAFTDRNKRIIELPDGSLGTLMLKRGDALTGLSRLTKDGWTVTGSGAQRRYVFTMRVYSGLLLADLTADPATAYSLQIEWRYGGKPYNCDVIPSTMQLGAIQPGDIPPPVPTAGFPVEWAREVWGETENVHTGTRYAGNILQGGPIETIRLSVAEYHAGLLVQIKAGGVDVFSSPRAITSQTMAWDVDDDPNLIALSNLANGAKIEVVTSVVSGSYVTPVKGLQVEIQVIGSERSALDTTPTAAYEWLKQKLAAGSNVTLTADDGEETITVASTASGGASMSYDETTGMVYATIAGTTYEWPANVRA